MFGGRDRVLAHPAVAPLSNPKPMDYVGSFINWQNPVVRIRNKLGTHVRTVSAKFALNCQLPSGKQLVM
ncbi:hypothetical protein FHR72_004424 [Mycolicibacterium iranicum]|uniref:Uncharacterized protein n=1 Tax=Mycolicibacterium iranicum TaxID=912594 RepID=A0A839QA22_MYCIR|nr:hypothetical protein [Mycolicibacterium iranicum]